MRGWVNDRYLLLLFAGLILGVVLVQTCQKSMLPGIFGTYFLSQYANLKIDTLRLLKYTGSYRAGQYLFVVCCGAMPMGTGGDGSAVAGAGNGDGNHAEYFNNPIGNKRNSYLRGRCASSDFFLSSCLRLGAVMDYLSRKQSKEVFVSGCGRQPVPVIWNFK